MLIIRLYSHLNKMLFLLSVPAFTLGKYISIILRCTLKSIWTVMQSLSLKNTTNHELNWHRPGVACFLIYFCLTSYKRWVKTTLEQSRKRFEAFNKLSKSILYVNDAMSQQLSILVIWTVWVAGSCEISEEQRQGWEGNINQAKWGEVHPMLCTLCSHHLPGSH